jgi:hypothetical protein
MSSTRPVCRVKTPRLDCAPSVAAKADSYEQVVGDFIRLYREPAVEEWAFYANCGSLTEAIRLAANAIAAPSVRPDGNRHPHQRQSTQELQEMEAKLQARAPDLGKCAAFHELFNLVGEIIRKRKVGDLAVYDVATRIGAYLGLEPELVYLHAGTKEGALALGLGRGRRTLAVHELPEAFWQLKPREIEDCLCIFKDRLRAIRQRMRVLSGLH